MTTFTDLDTATLATRLGVALLVGAAIGWDRQRAGKAAGMRTHMMISLGACLFVLVPLATGASAEAVSRTIQGVAAGVGFLGGGVILHQTRSAEERSAIKGLTSAAAIWATAALGVVAACGLWRTAALGVAAAVLVLVAVKPLERVLFKVGPDDDQT